MAQSTSPSLSDGRKRKFEDMITQSFSLRNSLREPSSLSTPSIDELSICEAISLYFQFTYNEQLELDQGSMGCMLDPSRTSLQKLQAASDFGSNFNDCKPFASNTIVWSYFTPAVADAIVDLMQSPSTFEASTHVAAGTAEVCSEDEPWMQSNEGLFQIFYTRVLDEGPLQYAEQLELYGRMYPEDLPYVILQLQYLGLGSRGLPLLQNVMEKLGYPDVKLGLDPIAESMHPSARPTYSGTTIRSPSKRQEEDSKQTDNSSRMMNFSKLTKLLNWRIFVWTPLQQSISDRLEWRTRKELGQVEAILTDCITPSFNKARGGWIHPIQLHPTISAPLKAMLDMLPKARSADPAPPALTTDLKQMIEQEQNFLRLLGDSEDFGKFFGEAATKHLHREFVHAIRCIKGSVSSTTVTKDLPQEAGHGRIDTSLAGGQVGRAVALYQAMMSSIHGLEGGEERDYEVLRQLDGAFIDFWHSFDLHKWWGLLVLLMGTFFRRVMPFAIHSWSAVVGGIFSSNLLYSLPRTLGIDTLQGPDVFAALKPNIIQHPVLKQTYHVPENRKFRDRQGDVEIVRIGTGKLDYANHLSKGDPGDLFYRQVLFRHDKRRHTLLNGLSVALNRLTEDHLALHAHPTTEKGKIEFLREIQNEFNRIVSVSGVREVLDEELRRQRVCDRAQGALLSKGLMKEEEVGEDPEGDGEDEVRPIVKKKRKTAAKSAHPRDNGLLALGEPYSQERRDQLVGLQGDAEVAKHLHREPEVLWPGGLTALSSEFQQVFLNLKRNHSLQLTLNAHGRTPAGIEGHKQNGRRLGGLRKEWALASRERKTELMGGWTRAEQFEEMTIIVPTLLVDMTGQMFPESPRAAKCPECLARVFGKDRHGSHRCTEETPAAEIVKGKFGSYIRLLYPHDIFTLSDVPLDVSNLVVKQCNLMPSPAVDWALDNRENVLPTFPFPIEDDLFYAIAGDVYWDTTKERDSPQNRLMAADVILRDICAGDDPLHMVSRAGMQVSTRARELYNVNQDKVWRHEFLERLAKNVKESGGKLHGCICVKCGDMALDYGRSRNDMMRHSPCKQHAKLQEKDFYWFHPRRLTDLPHSLARIILYRAVRGGFEKGQVKATGRGEGEKGLSVLLEWSG